MRGSPLTGGGGVAGHTAVQASHLPTQAPAAPKGARALGRPAQDQGPIPIREAASDSEPGAQGNGACGAYLTTSVALNPADDKAWQGLSSDQEVQASAVNGLSPDFLLTAGL